jgi:hypothetical protein
VLAVAEASIYARDRRPAGARNRQLIMFVAHGYGYSDAHIGGVLGRDGSSVYYGRCAVPARMVENADLTYVVREIQRRLNRWQSDEAGLRAGAAAAAARDGVATAADPIPLDELWRLKHKGWSVKGLARRYDSTIGAIEELLDDLARADAVDRAEERRY